MPAQVDRAHSACDTNVLRFCSAIQPCLHLQALQRAIGLPGSQWPGDIASAGEDLPSAYRMVA